MTNLALLDNARAYDLVIFDKDGTLIDFYHLWGRKIEQGIDAVMNHLGYDADLATHLYHSLGYDPFSGDATSDGPFATTTLANLATIVATVLYQNGRLWVEAEHIAQRRFLAILQAPPTPDLIQPIGNLLHLCQQLTQRGTQIGILTNDNRKPTETVLNFLGISDYISSLVCGDDGIPHKPAPNAIWHMAQQLDVKIDKIMLVGDNVTDLIAGTRAGIGCRVGVLSGTGRRELLQPHADLILDSIQADRPVQATDTEREP